MPRAIPTRPLCAPVAGTKSMAFGLTVMAISRCAGLPATDPSARFPMRVRKAAIRRCELRRMH